MSDNNQTPTGDNQGQTTDPKLAEATNNPGATQLTDKDKNFAETRKIIKDLSEKVAKFELEKSEAEKKRLEEQGEYKTLLEKEKAEKADILNQIQTKDRNNLVNSELSKSGINSEIVDLILPSILDKVTFSKDNQPENLSAVLEDLKQTKPSLFVTTTTFGKVGTGVTTGGSATSDYMSKEEALQILASGNSKLITANEAKITKAINL